MKFKIGDRVAVTYLADSRGEIVGGPAKVLGHTHYGIKFDNQMHNAAIGLKYFPEKVIYKIGEYDE